MNRTLSWIGIASAVVVLSSCAHSNKFTSDLGDDTPVNLAGQKIAFETPGSQGPVADRSRLAINHRDVARREAAARERLAREAEARRRAQVADQTQTRSGAPVVAAPTQQPAKKPIYRAEKKERKAVAMKKRPARVAKNSDVIRSRRGAPVVSRQSGMAPGAVREMVREVALNQLHHINQKEIAMAKLAEDRAASASVKAAAKRIQQDHQRLEARVEEVAKRRDISLAGFQANTYEGVAKKKLENLSGRDFDFAFVQNMEDGHKVTANQLRVLRTRVADPEVVALIDQTLPKVQQHREHSENILSSIKTNNDISARR